MSQDDYEQRLRDSFLEQRKQLTSSSLEISGRYDNAIITLPGAALGLSLGFLEKIAPNPILESRIWIGCAWGLFGCALITGFVSIFCSQQAVDKQIENLDEEHRTRCSRLPNHWCKAIVALNWISMITFTIGVVALCVFAFKNFPSHQTIDAKKVTNSVPVQPAVTNQAKP